MLAAAREAPDDLEDFRRSAGVEDSRLHWLVSPAGRAIQMNHGAASARGTFLWFLHADSRFDQSTLPALRKVLARRESCLWYFRLRFFPYEPPFVRLNEWGAWLRSRWVGLPFGDQGFLMPRRMFFELGTYDVGVEYGEDHLMVWKAREHGYRVRWTGGTLFTSSRKYREKGWLRTTSIYWIRTLKQAMTCYLRIMRKRAGR